MTTCSTKVHLNCGDDHLFGSAGPVAVAASEPFIAPRTRHRGVSRSLSVIAQTKITTATMAPTRRRASRLSGKQISESSGCTGLLWLPRALKSSAVAKNSRKAGQDMQPRASCWVPTCSFSLIRRSEPPSAIVALATFAAAQHSSLQTARAHTLLKAWRPSSVSCARPSGRNMANSPATVPMRSRAHSRRPLRECGS